MTTYIGRDGSVTVAANVLGELTGWSIEETGNVVADTVMGDVAETFKPTTTQWSGSADCFFDEDDLGQIAFAVGSEVALEVQPRGVGAGIQEMTGQAIVTGVTRRAERVGLIEISFTFQGSGILTKADQV